MELCVVHLAKGGKCQAASVIRSLRFSSYDLLRSGGGNKNYRERIRAGLRSQRHPDVAT